MIPEYIKEVVIPTVQEYLDDTTNKRKCFLACTAIFHVVDRIAAEKLHGLKKPTHAAEYIRKKCPSFSVVESVTMCFKHVKHGGGNQVRLKEGEIIERASASWDEGIWDLSRWDDEEGGVEAGLEAGSDDVTAAVRVTHYIPKTAISQG